jgi:hypothetical protein
MGEHASAGVAPAVKRLLGGTAWRPIPKAEKKIFLHRYSALVRLMVRSYFAFSLVAGFASSFFFFASRLGLKYRRRPIPIPYS